jgi:uncharacterized membrane protein
VLIFKTLHILAMFSSVTVFLGQGLFIARAVQRRDVRALAATYTLAGKRVLTGIGVGLLLLGVVFGLLTAATAGFDFLKGWLIVAYLLAAAIIAFNNLPIVRRIFALAERAVEADAGRQPAQDVARDMATTPTLAWLLVNVALYVAVIADMVWKPF